MQRNKLNFIGKKPDEKTIEEIGKLIYAYESLQDMQRRFHPSHAYYYHHSLAQIATVEKKDLPFNFDHKPTIQILPLNYEVSYEDLIAKPKRFTKESIQSSTLEKRIKIINKPIQQLIKDLLDEKKNVLANSLADEVLPAGGPSEYNAQEENLARSLTILFALPIRYPKEGFDAVGTVFRLDNIYYLKEGTLQITGDPLSVIFSAEPDFRRFNQNEKSQIRSIVLPPNAIVPQMGKDEKSNSKIKQSAEIDDKTYKEIRDRYICGVAHRIRVAGCEHKIFLQKKTSKKYTQADGARGMGAFEGNPLLILTIMRSVFDNEKRYVECMVDDFLAITSKITMEAPVSLEELARAVWACKDAAILNKILDTAPIHLPFYYKKHYHAKRYFLEDPLFQEFRAIMQKSHGLLMPSQEELIILGKNQEIINKNFSAEDKMRVLKQDLVAGKSIEKSPIIISLEQILTSNHFAVIKKEKIKNYIKQICQNPHVSFKITGGEIEKIDLFFTKPEICQLMTVRTRLSAYLSKIPQGHEGKTIREIRSYLDNLRLIAFSKSDPLEEKTFIKLMSTRIYGSAGKAKVINPTNDYVYQMYHIVITPGVLGEMSAQEVAVRIKLFLVQLLKKKKLDKSDGVSLIITLTNNEYQTNYPKGSYFIRLYPDQYEEFISWINEKEFLKDRFPKNPEPNRTPPQVAAIMEAKEIEIQYFAGQDQEEQKSFPLSLESGAEQEKEQKELPAQCEYEQEKASSVSNEDSAKQIKEAVEEAPAALVSQPEEVLSHSQVVEEDVDKYKEMRFG